MNTWLRICAPILFIGVGLNAASAQTPRDAFLTRLVKTVSELQGLPPSETEMRRDPSDIIQVNGTYYVWYTKGERFHGFDGSIWYATSPDGKIWTEQGEAVPRGTDESPGIYGVGREGPWNALGVYTPNIMIAEGRYWLFYSAAPKNMPDLNDTARTSIALSVADSPDGPWTQVGAGPVLLCSTDPAEFDSLRVDDAALVVRDGRYWLYYKGRQWDRKASETQMGVAIAEQPEGPYVKYAGSPVMKVPLAIEAAQPGKRSEVARRSDFETPFGPSALATIGVDFRKIKSASTDDIRHGDADGVFGDAVAFVVKGFGHA